MTRDADDTQIATTAADRPGTTPASTPDGPFRLEIGGRSFVITPGEIIIGRSTEADIVIDSPAISRRHARVVCDGGAVLLEDLASRNGTYVDEKRLDSPVEISDRCGIRLGPIWCTLFVQKERP